MVFHAFWLAFLERRWRTGALHLCVGVAGAEYVCSHRVAVT